jgi:hypothetical protein
MQKKIQDELQWIDVELSVEMAKIGQERNEAYIQQLRAWKRYWCLWLWPSLLLHVAARSLRQHQNLHQNLRQSHPLPRMW